MEKEDVFEYAIYYPTIDHSLYFETDSLKMKYVGLFEYFAKQFYGDNNVIQMRVLSLKRNLLDGVIDSTQDLFDDELEIKKILKTGITPFRLFSYRYAFLFDCILLLAPDDKALGNDICDSFKVLVHERYHNGMDVMVEQMYARNSGYAKNKLITTEMMKVWEDTRTYVTSQNSNITFTATMSAGKSTLVNAIIGHKLSYTKKASCTEVVMNFISAPIPSQHFNVFSKGKHEATLDAGEIRAFTKDRKESCDIIGNFNSILTDKKTTLIDTPGVDSSQNPVHRIHTRTELESDATDLLVYVIPLGNYGSESDYEHLSYIKNEIRYQEIVFVVNMMDMCDTEDDSVKEIIANVSDHLTGIGFKQPTVCPLSARAGLLMKRALNGHELTENDTWDCEDFQRKFLNASLDLSGYYPKVNRFGLYQGFQEKAYDKNIEKLEKAYINTGLPGFEKMVLEKQRGV